MAVVVVLIAPATLVVKIVASINIDISNNRVKQLDVLDTVVTA